MADHDENHVLNVPPGYRPIHDPFAVVVFVPNSWFNGDPDPDADKPEAKERPAPRGVL